MILNRGKEPFMSSSEKPSTATSITPGLPVTLLTHLHKSCQLVSLTVVHMAVCCLLLPYFLFRVICFTLGVNRWGYVATKPYLRFLQRLHDFLSGVKSS